VTVNAYQIFDLETEFHCLEHKSINNYETMEVAQVLTKTKHYY